MENSVQGENLSVRGPARGQQRRGKMAVAIAAPRHAAPLRATPRWLGIKRRKSNFYLGSTLVRHMFAGHCSANQIQHKGLGNQSDRAARRGARPATIAAWRGVARRGGASRLQGEDGK